MLNIQFVLNPVFTSDSNRMVIIPTATPTPMYNHMMLIFELTLTFSFARLSALLVVHADSKSALKMKFVGVCGVEAEEATSTGGRAVVDDTEIFGLTAVDDKELSNRRHKDELFGSGTKL